MYSCNYKPVNKLIKLLFSIFKTTFIKPHKHKCSSLENIESKIFSIVRIVAVKDPQQHGHYAAN